MKNPSRSWRGGVWLFPNCLIAIVFILWFQSVSCAQEGTESAEILFAQATIAYEDGRYSDALRDLLKAHELDPRNSDVIYYLGLTYNSLGEHGQAANYLRRGLEIEPKNYDIKNQLGIALYGLNDFDGALKEFLAVYEAEPQRENIGYYIGLCYYQKKDYDNALTYFQRNVSTDVRSRQLNQYYTALTLRDLGREADAIEELMEAVKLDPVSPIVGAAQQLLSALRVAGGLEKRLRLQLTLNAHYDSNISALPTVTSLAPKSGRSRSYGNLFNLRADYSLYQSERWESTVTYGLLQTLNYQIHSFDIHDQSIAANLFYKTLTPDGMPLFIGTQFNHDILLLAGKKFLERPTGAVSFSLVENPNNASNIFFRLQYRDFFQKPTEDDERRDAINKLFGLVHFIRLFGGQHQINFGYHYDNEDAQGRNWRYSGHKAVAGLLLSLPWDLKATTNFEYHLRYYKGQNSTFEEHRRDGQRTVLFSLAKDLPQNLTVTLQHLWDNNQSSIGFFKSRRQVYAWGLTWRY